MGHHPPLQALRGAQLLSIAMKPLCEPPFPLDRIEEMTALMGDDGRLR